jgi:quercetin dioxygenase-like cupin family protein
MCGIARLSQSLTEVKDECHRVAHHGVWTADSGRREAHMSDRTSTTLEPATPSRLADLADIAEHAVVSRTLATTSGGTVTLFAFDTGQKLSEHSAPFDAFVQVLDGRLSVTIGGRPYKLAAGDCVLMPADVPHAVRCTEAARMLLVMLRGEKKE